jgi:hypothetical protein
MAKLSSHAMVKIADSPDRFNNNIQLIYFLFYFRRKNSVEYSFENLKKTILNQPNNPTHKMAKVQDYVVITSSKGIENLESLIKENIRRGWQPLGGICIVNGTNNSDEASGIQPTMFAQAMVLYDN